MAAAFAFFSDKIGKGYQWYRILAVIDPENATGWAPSEPAWKNIIYQQQRGEIAIGSGGIFGNGLFERPVLQRAQRPQRLHPQLARATRHWLRGPAAWCWGSLLAHGDQDLRHRCSAARTCWAAIICAGIGGALMAQIAVNVGMNLRVLPVIGVTLPFYSAGGSSVLMLYICVGLVLSVYMHNTKSLFG